MANTSNQLSQEVHHLESQILIRTKFVEATDKTLETLRKEVADSIRYIRESEDKLKRILFLRDAETIMTEYHEHPLVHTPCDKLTYAVDGELTKYRYGNWSCDLCKREKYTIQCNDPDDATHNSLLFANPYHCVQNCEFDVCYLCAQGYQLDTTRSHCFEHCPGAKVPRSTCSEYRYPPIKKRVKGVWTVTTPNGKKERSCVALKDAPVMQTMHFVVRDKRKLEDEEKDTPICKK